MFRDICTAVYQNKNILMLTCVGIYILSLFSVFSGSSVIFAGIITLAAVYFMLKNTFPLKIIIVWVFIFYLGILNTSFRLKDTDDLLNLTPVNATIYGKIVSIPQTKDAEKQKFFFNVNKIEYDGISESFDNEKVLVTINSEEKFRIYDSYKIRGRLSPPMKAGNPSQFDYGNYLRNFNTYAVFYGRNPYDMRDLDIPCYEKIEVKENLSEKFLRKVNDYRDNVLNIHSKYLQSPNLEILGGIVFGNDAVNPPENIKQSFVNSGLLHILAASGMNVAFIFTFFFFLINLFKINYKINVTICILAVITYVLMTGLGASVVRAGMMLIFVLIGKLIDRDAHNIALLSFVALLMLLYNPMYINDVGFQLSFIVTFGLVMMTPLLIKSENKIIDWIIGSVSVPVIAQLWVIPIQIFYFNNISIYSVFANIMSVPILYVISAGGFISSLLSAIKPLADIICKIFDFIINPLISLLVKISDFWGSLPNSSLQTTHPSVFQLILYYCILLAFIGLLNKEFRDKYLKPLLISLPVFAMILLLSAIPHVNNNLEITAFDVGNADAFMIKTPDNKYILVDTAKSGYNGGKSQAEMIILKYMKDNGIKNIDTLIITHFDNDHCGGAVDIINNLNVKRIYVNSLNHNSIAANDIYQAANKNNTKIILSENNQPVLDENEVKITNFFAGNTKGIGDNESSIVTLLEYGKFTMLFTGDAGVETFNMLKIYIPKNITVLKVGHHGAPGVINKDMASYLNPKYSVVSTGENKFGHPSIYTLETLNNSTVLRTDLNNSIRFTVKGDDIKLLTYDERKRKYTKFE